MKKHIFFFIIFLSWLNLTAQLDREHWFAPMIDRSTSSNPNQKLYLSTNRTTPFSVTIYNNNVVIGTVNLSKGNPQKFDIPREFIITTQQSDLFTPTTKGIYVRADFPFYANLRFSVFNHAEIITSKGIASTGKKFYAAMAPITVSNGILDFMTSVLATEDNTSVTISNYKPGVVFSNGTTGATNPTITFTLNKGQSYIIDGIGTSNTDGFIGSKIEADKPVNVTNGNFNGQYAGSHPNSSDILMDQSVPVNQLGTQFALVKGNGTIGSNMEGALVVATENNTAVYVNNEVVPVATLNEGQYFVIPDTKYADQGNGHYNLYLTTSKNAYVYQLLAGDSVSGNVIATGGFNFIPALNCYLPKQINELGFIDENFVYSNANPTGILNIPTKLNLITEKGAVVQVNGAIPPAITGPYNMTGNNNWVTYGIPNTTGTITVTSSKAITAGITAGSDAVGYGGFFAGFPTTPVILKSGGTCVPGLVLTIDPIMYDTYQWYRNGFPISGATGASYAPTQSGNYSCSVTMGSCAPLLAASVPVQNCTLQSSVTYNICTTQTIIPTFTNSVQTPIPGSVNIITPPNSGTATINPSTGAITYTTTNTGNPFTDTFVYNFCGNDTVFPDCETVTVTINVQNIPVNNTTIYACKTVNNFGTYNLTSAVVTSQSPVTTQYYPTLADAQNQNTAAEILNTTTYSASGGTIVYAVVTSSQGCKNIAEILLSYFPTAQVLNNYTAELCDDDLDGSITVNLSTITPNILQNPTYFTVRYYASLTDATAGNTTVLPNMWTYIAPTIIYIRVDSPDGCDAVIEPVNFTFGGKVSLMTNAFHASVCDNDLDGVKVVNLSDYITNFTTDNLVTYSFHTSLNNAQNGINPLTNLLLSASGSSIYYIRFNKNGACPETAQLTLTVKTPKKSDLLHDQMICADQKITLDAGSGFDAYLWNTGATSSSISNVTIGNYWVDLTYNGCVYRQEIHISAPPAPTITLIEIGGSSAIIHVAEGTPPYEYSLDGINWQTSNNFINLPRGSYTVHVRDAYRCEIIKRKFFIINLINAITPNDDGYNDTIGYPDLQSQNDLVFRIFDRYGAEIFRGSPENNYTWNGRFSKKSVYTATYWYILSWTDPDDNTVYKYSSWLLVKNKN